MKSETFKIKLSDKAMEMVKDSFEVFLELQIAYKKFIDGDFGMAGQGSDLWKAINSNGASVIRVGRYQFENDGVIYQLKSDNYGDIHVSIGTM